MCDFIEIKPPQGSIDGVTKFDLQISTKSMKDTPPNNNNNKTTTKTKVEAIHFSNGSPGFGQTSDDDVKCDI